MPGKNWHFVFSCITITFFYFGQLILSDIGPFETRSKWLAGIWGTYGLLSGAIYWLIWRAGKGTVTAGGLEPENGPAIPLSSIERIVSEGGGFPAVVSTSDDKVKMHMADREFIKLAKTRLNKWTLEGKELTVVPGEGGLALKITYDSLGRYDTYKFASLSSLIIVVFLMAIIIHVNLHRYADWLYNACIIYGFIFLILEHYRRVRVTVEGDRVLMKRGKKEESFRFGEVIGMEKGLFQVKVTTKDGKIFFFPRGCLFLPEIIEEFAGLAGR